MVPMLLTTLVVNICDVQYLGEPDDPRNNAEGDQSVEVNDVEKFVAFLSNNVSGHIMADHEYQYCIKGEHNVDAYL